MKRGKMIALVIALIACLSGCGDKKKTDEVENNTYFMKVSNEWLGSVVVDTRTGVQYWRAEGNHNGGTLTLLVDREGKPLIYDEGETK